MIGNEAFVPKPQFDRTRGTLNEIYHPASWVARLYEGKFGLRTNQVNPESIDALIINGERIWDGGYTMREGRAVFAVARIATPKDQYGNVPEGRLTSEEIGPLVLGKVLGQEFNTRLLSLGRTPLVGFPHGTVEGVFEVTNQHVSALKHMALDEDAFPLHRFKPAERYLLTHLKRIGAEKILGLWFLAPVSGSVDLGVRKSARDIEAKRVSDANARTRHLKYLWQLVPQR